MSSSSHSSPLLIDEEPLQVLPGLAVKVGLNEAIFLQQLHYWLRKSKHLRDGRRWVYNSFPGWRESNFPFWSEDTIERAVRSLRKQRLVIVEKPGGRDRKNWYTIDYKELNDLFKPDEQQPEADPTDASESEPPSPQDADVHLRKMRLSDTARCGDASPQDAEMEERNLRLPSPQNAEMFNKDSETTPETTREHTHTARARDASPDEGVCVGKSRYPFDLRSRYASESGLGTGWLTNSADGRYDDGELFQRWLIRQQPDSVDARHREQKPNLMPLPAARDYVRSVLSVGAGTDGENLVEQLFLDGKVTEEVKNQLLEDLPALSPRAREPSAA